MILPCYYGAVWPVPQYAGQHKTRCQAKRLGAGFSFLRPTDHRGATDPTMVDLDHRGLFWLLGLDSNQQPTG